MAETETKLTREDVLAWDLRRLELFQVCETYLAETKGTPGNFDGIEAIEVSEELGIEFSYSMYARGCYDHGHGTVPWDYLLDHDAWKEREERETREFEERRMREERQALAAHEVKRRETKARSFHEDFQAWLREVKGIEEPDTLTIRESHALAGEWAALGWPEDLPKPETAA